MSHKKALILNASYYPIGLTSWQKAITLQCKDLISVVHIYHDEYVTQAKGPDIPCISVAALKTSVVHKKKIPFSRKNVFIRDRLKCQYCGNKFHHSELTFDHVISRYNWALLNKKGTPTCWENIVTCCRPCNHRKAHKMLEEAKMKLIRKPIKPDAGQFVLGIAPWTVLEKDWLPYVPKFYKDICSVRD